jgi:hypothetical protein
MKQSDCHTILRIAHVSAALVQNLRRSPPHGLSSWHNPWPDTLRPSGLGPCHPEAVLPAQKHDEAARKLYMEDEVTYSAREWMNAAPHPRKQKTSDPAANRHRQTTKPQNWPTWQNSRHSNKIFLKRRHVRFSSYVNACSNVKHRSITAASFSLLVAAEVQHSLFLYFSLQQSRL